MQEADTDPSGEAATRTQQMLTYYELDLGLNHVVRKYSEQLEEHANFLISGQFSHQACVFLCVVFSNAQISCRVQYPVATKDPVE